MDSILAKRLSDLRRERKLSQEYIAGKLGVSRQAVSKWENGTAIPSTANLITLADLYQVSVDEIIGEANCSRTTDCHTLFCYRILKRIVEGVFAIWSLQLVIWTVLYSLYVCLGDNWYSMHIGLTPTMIISYAGMFIYIMGLIVSGLASIGIVITGCLDRTRKEIFTGLVFIATIAAYMILMPLALAFMPIAC